jgi:hypothetical protein
MMVSWVFDDMSDIEIRGHCWGSGNVARCHWRENAPSTRLGFDSGQCRVFFSCGKVQIVMLNQLGCCNKLTYLADHLYAANWRHSFWNWKMRRSLSVGGVR